MANGQSIILRGKRTREVAAVLIEKAPDGAVMSITPPRRTNDQNARLWAMLSAVSRAKPEGRTLTPDVWKCLFIHSLDHEQRFEMALDGRGFVPMGFRSSRMTKAQFSDLFAVIEEYAARHGIDLGDSI